ncbi:NUDIX hydrolase [Candidatus Poribacteria bacterium]|nr:NUDIX hydrolase [Candidatus Poribacteria bacterium]
MTVNQRGSDNEAPMVRAICAAGGLVWRQSPRGLEVAVIHRARYGDWCLPKGKLKPGETWQEAALREVKEEIGCEARITSFAGEISYQVDGIPKVVRFWNMVPTGECSFQASEEVDEVIWLEPHAAIERLDYPQEKALVAKVYSS